MNRNVLLDETIMRYIYIYKIYLEMVNCNNSMETILGIRPPPLQKTDYRGGIQGGGNDNNKWTKFMRPRSFNEPWVTGDVFWPTFTELL